MLTFTATVTYNRTQLVIYTVKTAPIPANRLHKITMHKPAPLYFKLRMPPPTGMEKSPLQKHKVPA